MKTILLILCVSFFLFSCEKDSIESLTIEEVLQKNKAVKTFCSLNNNNPIKESVRTFSSYNCIGTGLSCSYTGSSLPCFARKLGIATETEILNQSGLQGTFNPNTTYYDSGEAFSIQLNTIIETDDIDPIMNASKANIVYRAVTCEILSQIEELPSLPSGQGYGIDFVSLRSTPVCIPSCSWYVTVQFNIVILS